MSLKERIKELRERKGFNQKQLADAAKVTQATISRIESDDSYQPKSESLIKLANALDTTVDYIIGKTDSLTSSEILEANPRAKHVFRGFDKLTENEQDMIAKFIESLEKKKNGETPKSNED